MSLLDRVLSAIGLGSSGSDRSRAEPDAESEAAVKGTDEPRAPASASTPGSETEDITEEPPEGKPGEDDEVEAATETAEAAGPGSQVEEPEPVDGATDRTALDEPADQAEAAQDEADDEAIEAAAEQAPGQTSEGASRGADGETADSDDAAADTDDAGAGDEPVDAADLEPEQPAGGGDPLESVDGIGPAYAERLNEAGIEDVAELAAADAASVSDATGISEKRIGRWIDRAKDH